MQALTWTQNRPNKPINNPTHSNNHAICTRPTTVFFFQTLHNASTKHAHALHMGKAQPCLPMLLGASISIPKCHFAHGAFQIPCACVVCMMLRRRRWTQRTFLFEGCRICCRCPLTTCAMKEGGEMKHCSWCWQAIDDDVRWRQHRQKFSRRIIGTSGPNIVFFQTHKCFAWAVEALQKQLRELLGICTVTKTV